MMQCNFFIGLVLLIIISQEVQCFDRDLTYKTQLKQLVGINLIYKTHFTFQFGKNLSHRTLCLSGERPFQYKTHPDIRHISYYCNSTVVTYSGVDRYVYRHVCIYTYLLFQTFIKLNIEQHSLTREYLHENSIAFQ